MNLIEIQDEINFILYAQYVIISSHIYVAIYSCCSSMDTCMLILTFRIMSHWQNTAMDWLSVEQWTCLQCTLNNLSTTREQQRKEFGKSHHVVRVFFTSGLYEGKYLYFGNNLIASNYTQNTKNLIIITCLWKI